MATVTRENIGNLHDKLTVKLAKDDYWPSFEKTLKQYAKNANVPGFRKGMVPSGMVRKMYGQSIFTDEVL
ncbi:MAG TPA: trigger factor family protein, partial [Flavipsychrobacter sp.]|nr:trigger factor family protein [Flavipsychrobacter sp.]